MNKNNLNYIEFEKVLSNIDDKSPPLWRYIVTNFEKIISAHERGMTYKKMSESLKVSQRSFSIALKKAKAEREKKNEVELKKVDLKIKNTQSNLPPPPGIKSVNNDFIPGVKKI